MFAGPASAAPVATDVGVFTGTTEVDPGLGLPVVTGGTGTWKLETTITNALHGTGPSFVSVIKDAFARSENG